jgi:hypothetical protein
MSRLSKLVSYSKSSNGSGGNRQSELGIVQDVVLDDKHPRIKDEELVDLDGNPLEDVETLSTELVGSAYIKPLKDSTSFPSQAIRYTPIDSTTQDIPIKGEVVRIFDIGGVGYFQRISSHELNIGNANSNKDLSYNRGTEKQTGNKTADYKEVSETQIPKSEQSNSSAEREIPLGDYFTPTKVNKLKLYEGDKLIQSRFGQSIRFSGYNNDNNIFSPTIIFRNRQNSNSLNNLKKGSIAEEDINRDGSIIVLSSNKYKMNFQPGLVDDGGSSDFKTTPIKAKLPKEYVGFDQMLLNSERIIISSKSQEMLFFSKGNYGFISDGKFTIDNGQGGADLDFGDDVNITTDRNNGNFTILTGTGNIFLNTTKKKERIVRGDTLVKLLSELIDAINKQVYNTPAGPSSVGPTNRSTFNDIKSKLKDALSTLNYTE